MEMVNREKNQRCRKYVLEKLIWADWSNCDQASFSSANWLLLCYEEKPKAHAMEARAHEVRPQGGKARSVQRGEAEVEGSSP